MRTLSVLHARVVGIMAACCAVLLVTPALAVHEDDEVLIDPPARVGRISALRGSVDTAAEPGAAWEAAKINQPVTSRTALWVTPGSQAEVRIGSASVRLDGNTQAAFSQLDDHGIAIEVAQGTVRARVRYLPSGDRFSFSADGVRAEAQGPGDYRVSYDPDRRAYTVRSITGRLRIVTPSTSLALEAGQEGLIEDGGESLHVGRLGQFDAFDAWAEARDREQDRLASARYVSPETTGIEALDEHGRWAVVADYGPVWYPRVLVGGWAPYRYGRWDWVHPWGWTWIDDAPWGFTPFHYGRWALISGAWGWVPGPIVHRPVYAPALVGYVGGWPRSGVSVSIGIGAPIGWFPLGPREVYVPPYRYTPRYGHRINPGGLVAAAGTDDRRVTRQPVPNAPIYRYAQRPEALTVSSENNFRAARPIGRERLPLTQQQITQLQPVAAALPGPRVHPDAVDRRGATGLPVLTLPAPPARTSWHEQRRMPVHEQPRAPSRESPLRAPVAAMPAQPVVPRAGAGVEPRLAPPVLRGGLPSRAEHEAGPRPEMQERSVRQPRIERDDPRDDQGRDRHFIAPRPAIAERPAAAAGPAPSNQVMPAPQPIVPPVATPRVMPAPAVLPPPRAIAAPPPPQQQPTLPPVLPRHAPPVMQAPPREIHKPAPRQLEMPAPPPQARQAPPGWGQHRGGDGPGRNDGGRAGHDAPRGDGPRGMRVER